MIMKCPYCDYAKADEPLSILVLQQISAADGILEDQLLWMYRLMDLHGKQYGFSSYRGVKVHIGLKHKGMENWPRIEFNKQEKRLIDV